MYTMFSKSYVTNIRELLLSISGAFFRLGYLSYCEDFAFLDCDQAIATKFDEGRARGTVTASARGGLLGVFLQRHQVPAY